MSKEEEKICLINSSETIPRWWKLHAKIIIINYIIKNNKKLSKQICQFWEKNKSLSSKTKKLIARFKDLK